MPAFSLRWFSLDSLSVLCIASGQSVMRSGPEKEGKRKTNHYHYLLTRRQAKEGGEGEGS
jgi:hypothetical protein